MKRAKNLIILVAVLAVLIGVFFVVKTFVKDPDAESETPETPTYTVSELDAETLAQVHLKITESTDSSATVRDMTFKVNSSGSGWVWTDDETVPIANDAFVDLVTELQDASSTVKMEDVTAEKLEEYGLAAPFIVAEFTKDDGTSVTYHVGDLNNFSSCYYFSNAAEPNTVYMVDSYVVSALNLSVKDTLQWDTVPSVTTADITSLTLETNAHKYVYSYYPNGKDSDYTGLLQWYLAVDSGAEFPVSETLSEDLASAISYLYFNDVVHFTGEVPEEYGLSSSATVTWTLAYNRSSTVTDSETGTETTVTTPATYVLTLGTTDESGYYYCKTEDSQLIYTLGYSEIFGPALSEDMTSLRQKALLSYDIDRIATMKMTASGATLAVTVSHNADGVSYTDDSGIAFDLTSFTAVTDALSAMRATSDTSLVEPVSSAGNDVIFLAEFTYNTGDVTSSALEIRNYSESYCRVSFMGRDDQLVTKEDALALADTFAAYFKDKNT